ncbi:hydrogenase metallocenter assembly protein HypF [Klebsiella pneumoniae]|uniref:Carbamoyltransferase HypF n=1 Tax=Klebsiella pneumoniae TaxID=573 RepID=A0A378FP50_KLEPN|nr:hydrogenase metallocenter assembly protein HypF [Klebsiella pneumoniae]
MRRNSAILPIAVFHAQPVACPDCGPRLEWRAEGETLDGEAALQAAIARLAAGDIVAIKGIGGFHLACDAGNPAAVATLRARKHRPAKPLAVMLPTATGLPAAAAALMGSPAAPIVLIAKAQVSGLCDEITPGLAEVGVMLPSNPLQHLLLQGLARPIVMTSGNLSGRPPALSNAQALNDLADIADGFLLHNRDIVQRMDDSLVRSSGEMLRRARGYVPDALPLPPGLGDIPPLLALGADMKNTFCLARGSEAVLSQHFGDLGEEGVEQQWRSALQLMQSIYAFVPQRVVVDAHPGYRSTQWAASLPLPLETVLHHHAHAAACLAEHRWPLDGGDVIALTLDGIGMGENGALWGGECLRVNYRECEHLGGLPAVALPGGDLAARQPWRNLLAHCLAFVPDWQDYPQAATLRQRNWPLLAQAIERGINAPRASSCGRLFDAVACALDCAPESLSYEGEAACRLEALAASCPGVSHPVTLPWRDDALDLATFWRQWLSWQATPAQKAWAFHDALACGLAAMARDCATVRGIDTMVCSGGVLHNRLLAARLTFYLADFTLLFAQQLPAGDGAIAYGQAVIAAARGQAQGIQP